MKYIFFGILLICASSIGLFNLFQLNINKQKNKQQIQNSKFKTINEKKIKFLNQVWHDDFKRLINSGEIPKAWLKIKKIDYYPTDSMTMGLVKFLKAPIYINSKGIYRLEVTLISHISEKGKTKILFQHNIVENENGNTIWELNRTYNYLE